MTFGTRSLHSHSPQNGANQCKVAVRRPSRGDLFPVELYAINQRSVDFFEEFPSQVRIEPAKLCLVIVVRGLVLRFQEPAQYRFFPSVPGLYAESVLLPSGGGELVMDLLRLPLVGSPSALL